MEKNTEALLSNSADLRPDNDLPHPFAIDHSFCLGNSPPPDSNIACYSDLSNFYMSTFKGAFSECHLGVSPAPTQLSSMSFYSVLLFLMVLFNETSLSFPLI